MTDLPYGFDDPESRAMIERQRARWVPCNACGHDRLRDSNTPCPNCEIQKREQKRALNRTAPARDRRGRRIGRSG